jgi:hypothetical protein
MMEKEMTMSALREIVASSMRPDREQLANLIAHWMVNQTVREWLNSLLPQSKVDVEVPDELPPGFRARMPPLMGEGILRSDAEILGLSAVLVADERLRDQVSKRYIEELEGIKSKFGQAIDQEIDQLRKAT